MLVPRGSRANPKWERKRRRRSKSPNSKEERKELDANDSEKRRRRGQFELEEGDNSNCPPMSFKAILYKENGSSVLISRAFLLAHYFP